MAARHIIQFALRSQGGQTTFSFFTQNRFNSCRHIPQTIQSGSFSSLVIPASVWPRCVYPAEVQPHGALHSNGAERGRVNW